MTISILMVEDSPADAELIERTLRRAGITGPIRRFSNRAGFAEALRAERPDVVISDHNLPQFDGRDVLRLVQSLEEPPPFILITGSLNEETAVEYMKSGAADYILKDSLIRLTPAVIAAVEHDRDRRAKAAAERATRETEERLSLLLRATNDAVWDLDLVDGSLRVNGELLALIGHPAGAPLTLESWHQCIHPDDRMRVRDGLDTVLRSGTSFWTDEYRLRRSDGTYARVADRGLVMRNPSGKPIRVVGALMDVTETQRLQEQLVQAQKMEAIGRLAGGIAHDFNNLLTGILVSTHMLEDAASLPRDEVLLEVTEIRKAAERASALTRQLLAFSRKQVMALTRIDLNETVRSVATMLERTLGADIQLRLQLADPPGTVRADAGQVEQILLNLAVNARDAMPGGGTLTIATACVDVPADDGAEIAPGPYVALRVTDTGSGMDAATQDRMFEPFFTTKDVGQGTGLGLSTVYGIVRQHGGHIAVDSEIGRGTTFTIHLPRVDGRPEEPVAEKPAEHHGGPERILLVEDDPGVRATIHRMLVRLGYTVVSAATAEEAWTAIQTQGTGIELIVSDVQLAEGNGPALVARIREAGFQTPVVFLSGYAEETVLPDGRLPDRSSFLAKPFTPASLANRVRQALS